MRFCRSKRAPSALDRGAHEVAPLGPRSVVVPDLLVAKQVGQHKPSVRRALPYPAVRYDVVASTQAGLTLVDLTQLICALEGPVLPHRPGPRHVRCTWDVPTP